MWNRWRVASKAFFGSKKSQSCIGSACTFATQPTRGDEPNFLELLDHPLTRMFVANVQGHNCKRKILFIQGKNNSGLERNFAKKKRISQPKKTAKRTRVYDDDERETEEGRNGTTPGGLPPPRLVTRTKESTVQASTAGDENSIQLYPQRRKRREKKPSPTAFLRGGGGGCAL